MWVAAMASDAQFAALTQLLFKFTDETPDRVPLTDWYCGAPGGGHAGGARTPARAMGWWWWWLQLARRGAERPKRILTRESRDRLRAIVCCPSSFGDAPSFGAHRSGM